MLLSLPALGVDSRGEPAQAAVRALRVVLDPPVLDQHLRLEQAVELLEAQVLIEDWRIEYNTKRPHSSLGWLAPATYAERWEAQQYAGLS